MVELEGLLKVQNQALYWKWATVCHNQNSKNDNSFLVHVNWGSTEKEKLIKQEDLENLNKGEDKLQNKRNGEFLLKNSENED